MARFIVRGQRYTLKPQRADDYGIARGTTFTIIEVFTLPGYSKLWVRVAELPSPENVLMASDFKAGLER